MCDRGILKEHSMNSWYQWVPSPAMSLAGSVCATASSEVPWQRALLAATLMWMPLFCIGLIVLAWRSYTGRFYISSSPPGLGLRRLWLACSAAYAVTSFWRSYTPRGTFHQLVSAITGVYWPSRGTVVQPSESTVVPSRSARSRTRVADMMSDADLTEFQQRIERQSTETFWEIICEKTTPDTYYVAWRHILPDGGTEYFSRTVVENACPDAMIAFYNHDECRLKWDGLLVDSQVLDVDSSSGTEAVWWKRSLPCCGLRDYVFGRRTWQENGAKFTITKGSTHPMKPRGAAGIIRVDPYYSSWRIRAVPARTGSAKTAVETTLIHYEEMSIQHDVARFAVRQGMWSVVKNLLKGYRSFHLASLADPSMVSPSHERNMILLDKPEELEVKPPKVGVGANLRKHVGRALRAGGAGAVRVIGFALVVAVLNKRHNSQRAMRKSD
eukprot:CAMPEP_0114298304 /NCGR_PEP_ID=MMETSP0059-20121206/12345_1 /TAXON_ID=36894 /ORGANISM="Pyramimonas parkeae, Strain CCMP726" /LENGTH=440 /DNA_ID=CAMNT_0001420653 /DNA_START=593 /DNA_END=1915 /DNA_ORIENTATION=-